MLLRDSNPPADREDIRIQAGDHQLRLPRPRICHWTAIPLCTLRVTTRAAPPANRCAPHPEPAMPNRKLTSSSATRSPNRWLTPVTLRPPPPCSLINVNIPIGGMARRRDHSSEAERRAEHLRALRRDARAPFHDHVRRNGTGCPKGDKVAHATNIRKGEIRTPKGVEN